MEKLFHLTFVDPRYLSIKHIETQNFECTQMRFKWRGSQIFEIALSFDFMKCRKLFSK